MSEAVLIFGTGGHARDVAEVVRALGRKPVFVSHSVNEEQSTKTGDRIIPEDLALRIENADFAIGIGDNRARARIASTYAHLRFPALIHPDASLTQARQEGTVIGAGAVIFAGARVMAGVSIGCFCTMNLNVTVSHDCDIGDFVNLSPGAHIAGNVCIGRGAWIGLGAVVNQGSDDRKLIIGAGTIVGSGTVVLRDCDPDAVYVGNPARKIR